MGKGSETEKQSKLKSKKFKLNFFPGIGVSPNQRRLRFWRMLETVCVTGSFSPGSRQAELLRKWLAPFKPDDLKQGPLLLLPLKVGVRKDRQERNVYCVGVQIAAVPRDSTELSHLRDSLCFLTFQEGMEWGT